MTWIFKFGYLKLDTENQANYFSLPTHFCKHRNILKSLLFIFYGSNDGLVLLLSLWGALNVFMNYVNVLVQKTWYWNTEKLNLHSHLNMQLSFQPYLELLEVFARRIIFLGFLHNQWRMRGSSSEIFFGAKCQFSGIICLRSFLSSVCIGNPRHWNPLPTAILALIP